MGRRKSGRNVSGVILLNKPRDITSNAHSSKCGVFFNANKAGHTGALDPLATGLLPLCFGEATKVSHFALEADKTYQVVAQLGARTTTSDAEGEIVERCEPDCLARLQQSDIEAAIAQFIGEQQQSPSMYSALKHEGRPLYWYARQGIEVPRKTRTIAIHQINFLGWHDNLLTLEVTCSKGTYIRTLIDDMGQTLGCGAYVKELHRTWIEGVEGEMLTLEQLAAAAALIDAEHADYSAVDGLLLPNDAVIQQIPEIQLDGTQAARFLSGNPAVAEAKDKTIEQPLRVFRATDQRFLGIGFWRQGLLAPKRVLNLE